MGGTKIHIINFLVRAYMTEYCTTVGKKIQLGLPLIKIPISLARYSSSPNTVVVLGVVVYVRCLVW